MLIDTHCHLNFEAFDKTVDNVIKRAKKAGVKKIVIPATDVKTAKKAIAIAEKYDGIYVAVGLHPHHLYEARSYKEDIQEIEALLQNKLVVAVGEVGVDRHEYRETKYGEYQWDESYMDRQKEILLTQIALAKKYNKALIIHNREAGEDLMGVIRELPLQKTVFHCCEAPVGAIHESPLLNFAKKHGIFIGVDGDITWSKKKQRFIKEVPIELLVLETDSPYLTPLELKPAINEPKNITIIRDMVAQIKEMSPEDVEKRTTENAEKLFGIE